MKRCLIVFAKEPRRGEVKTRLSRYLSTEQCLNLYKAFIKDTLNIAKRFKCEGRILAFESAKGSPFYLNSVGRRFTFYKQKGKDLGEKMHDAFRYAYRKKYQKIVIIGSDSPTLPSAFIKDAFEALRYSEVVLGPSLDGGFYLIGLKKTCYAIFRGIKWSSRHVLTQVSKNLRNLNKNTAFLPEWYDVDDGIGLSYLKHELKAVKRRKIAPWTRKFLKI